MNRYNIENVIITYNRAYYQKAHNMSIWKDKTHERLKEGAIRDKILKGNL